MEPEHHNFEKENHLPDPDLWVPSVSFPESMTVSDVDLHQTHQQTRGDQAIAQKGVGALVGWNTVEPQCQMGETMT